MKAGGGMRLFLLIPANILALGLAWLGLKTLAENLLGWFLLLLGAAYMLGSLYLMLPRNRALTGPAEGMVREEKGDRSFWLILPGFTAVFFLAPLEHLAGAARAGRAAQVLGLGLIGLAAALRIWVRLTLKDQYRGHVQVAAGKPLQTGGPYRYVRHPGYTGYLLMGLGIAAGYGSLLSALALFYLLLPALFYRMSVEEEMLAEFYGDAYLQYAARTPRLIPWLF